MSVLYVERERALAHGQADASEEAAEAREALSRLEARYGPVAARRR